MLLEVVKTDFIDIVSASIPKVNVLISDSESICLMVLFISTNSYAPGGNSISLKVSEIPDSNSGIFTIC